MDKQAKTQRLIVIGLDGVPVGLLTDLTDNGVMPNTAGLIQQGALKRIRSTVPEISSVAWSSIVTGVNPAEHGIFGFVELAARSYRIRFPNFSDIKSPPFWNRTPGKSVIINVPSTYPVREMNGVHISGFVSIDIDRSVHPTFLIRELQQLDYRLDVDAQKAHQDMGLFMEDLDQTLTARIKACEYLWDYTDWQVFMPVFTGTDRLMHFLWCAYEDKGHKYHGNFLEHFRKIDRAIGDILAKAGDDDAIIMLSDHGFGRLDKDVYVNYLLAEKGFLVFRGDAEPNPINIDSATKAFALDPARIYVNLKGKYPAGSVNAEDRAGCVDELESLFSSLEIEGRKVIKYIYRKEDIYTGPYMEDAPDLVLIADEGFNLKGAVTSKQLASVGPFTGKHTYEDAFLLLRDKALAENLNEEMSVIDAGKLIKSLAFRQANS